jgi:hypothetical protein
LHALSNKYAAEGLHGSSAYFNSIYELISKNIKSLTNDLIKNTLYAFSANKIGNFTASEFTEALNELTYTGLDKYETIFSDQAKPYVSNPAISGIVEKLKEKLRSNAHKNLILRVNKFDHDFCQVKTMKLTEKRSTRAHVIAWVSIILAIISFTAPFHGWKENIENFWIKTVGNHSA